MLRFATLIIVSVHVATTAWTAPEDRGRRGSYVALGAGLTVGTAVDDDGESAGSNTGQSFQLRFGEDVFDRLTLGLTLMGGSAEGNQSLYTSAHGGLLMDFSWQFDDSVPFLLVGGTGLGVGQLTEKGEEGFSGSFAGGIHMIGAQYELRWTKGSGSQITASPFVKG